jgi:lysophospholipase L1-like esterase
MKLTLKRKLTLLLLVIVLLANMMIPSVIFATDLKPYTIVALGDSITAGFEPDHKLGVDTYGFVERVEEQGWFHSETKAINLGVVGLTSEGLLNYVTALQTGTAVTADFIQADLKDSRIHVLASDISTDRQKLMNADVFTITIGGNDLVQVISRLKLSNVTQFKTDVNLAIAAYKQNLQKTIEIIYTINPTAKIVVADQYQPIPQKAVGFLYPFLQESMKQFTQSTETVASQFRKNNKQVQVVHLAELFKGKESVYTHIDTHRDIHPNQEGYQLIAKEISSLIWGNYLGTAGSEGKLPLAIVFRGHELKLTPVLSPLFANGAIYMPVSELINGLGGNVGWKNTTKSISIQFEGKELLQAVTTTERTNHIEEQHYVLLIDSKNSKQGRQGKQGMQGATTYISLQWITEQLGLKMKYSEHMKTVFLF